MQRSNRTPFSSRAIFAFILLVAACSAPLALYAQNTNPVVPPSNTNPSLPVSNTNPTPPVSNTNPGTGLQNPLGSTNSLTDLLGAILSFIVDKIAPVVITLMLVWCGFLFVVAQGNEEKIRSARTALTWTIIGALILLGAKVIEAVIVSTVGAL